MSTRTAQQIQSDINRCNSQINSCRNEREKYSTSLSSAEGLLSELRNSVNCVTQVSDSMKGSFNVAGKIAYGAELAKVQESINDAIVKMNVSVIPEINNKIKSLDEKIGSLRSQVNRLTNELRSAQSAGK